MAYINNITGNNDYYRKMNIQNLNNSLLNALRRIIISEIDIYGFESNIDSTKILENNTKYHNEFLAHRISLIPLNITIEDFEYENYKFVLNKENKDSESIINVGANDFQVYTRKDENSDWDISNESISKYFKQNKLSNDYIFICPLKNGEKISLECKLSKRNGKYNASFSPVCKSVFYNAYDVEKCEQVLAEILKKIDNSEQKEIKRKLFYNTDAYKYYKLNENNEPYNFVFEIESIGILTVDQIFLRSLDKLSTKLNNCKLNLKNKAISLSLSKDTNYKAYELILINEDDTLGNLFQSYIFDNFIKDDSILNFVSYEIPHPLENRLLLKFKLNELNKTEEQDKIYLRDMLFETIDLLLDILGTLKKEWIEKNQNISYS